MTIHKIRSRRIPCIKGFGDERRVLVRRCAKGPPRLRARETVPYATALVRGIAGVAVANRGRSTVGMSMLEPRGVGCFLFLALPSALNNESLARQTSIATNLANVGRATIGEAKSEFPFPRAVKHRTRHRAMLFGIVRCRYSRPFVGTDPNKGVVGSAHTRCCAQGIVHTRWRHLGVSHARRACPSATAKKPWHAIVAQCSQAIGGLGVPKQSFAIWAQAHIARQNAE